MKTLVKLILNFLFCPMRLTVYNLGGKCIHEKNSTCVATYINVRHQQKKSAKIQSQSEINLLFAWTKRAVTILYFLICTQNHKMFPASISTNHMEAMEFRKNASYSRNFALCEKVKKVAEANVVLNVFKSLQGQWTSCF